MEDNILDEPLTTPTEKNIPWFQYVDIGLYILLCLFLLISNIYVKEQLLIILIGTFSIFSIVKIYFEYKAKLITGFGILLKFLLVKSLLIAFISIIFKALDWPYAEEMIIVGIPSIVVFYLFYVISLKGINIDLKNKMGLSAFIISIFLFGHLFKMQSWPFSPNLYYGSLISMVIFFIINLFMFKKEMSPKEYYHYIFHITYSGLILLFSIYFIT